MEKKIWLITIDSHISDMEYLAASTEEKAEQMMRDILINDFHIEGDEREYLERCIAKHEWGNGQDYVHIVELDLDGEKAVI